MTRSLFSEQYDRLCQMLIQARVQAGMSQAQLAKCLRRPQSYVSKYETKQRRLDVVEFLEIAHCMNANGAELLHRLVAGSPTNPGAPPVPPMTPTDPVTDEMPLHNPVPPPLSPQPPKNSIKR